MTTKEIAQICNIPKKYGFPPDVTMGELILLLDELVTEKSREIVSLRAKCNSEKNKAKLLKKALEKNNGTTNTI